jgi:hypothetical protein
MNDQAKGTFDITSTPHTPDAGMQALGAMRITFNKAFQGDLQGTSVVEMMGMMDRELGSGAYVALEKVTGTLRGRSGTFALQHSSTMDRNTPVQRISVVPDSGTDGLKGLRGTMVIDIVEKQHYYTFDLAFGE